MPVQSNSCRRDPARQRRWFVIAATIARNLHFLWRRRPRAEVERLESRMMFSSSASGAESLITTSKTYAELNPVIAVDGSGNYVVVWSNDGQDVGEWGVYGQRFNASGTPVGSEFLINQTPVGEQPHPAVAMNASGSFVVSWTSRENNGGICAREYDSSGTPTGNAFLVATNRAGVQENSAVAIDSAGDVVVTWEGEGPGDTQGIFSRTYLSGNLPGTGLSTDTPSEVVQTNKSAIVTQRFAPTAATTNSQTAGPTKTTEHVDSKVARSTAIVFIDTSVPDWQLLVTGVHEAAPDDQVVLTLQRYLSFRKDFSRERFAA
jgi:hypothetical protein